MSDPTPEPPETEKPKAPANPEEITRKLEDFIKNTLGGQVLFTRIEGPGGRPAADGEAAPQEPEADPGDGEVFEFNYKPADIKAHLDRFVIRQDEAKKVLATAVCDHYHHARMLREDRESNASGPALEFSKQNVIIIGPTGVGKTYLVKHIADLIGVPFVKADATKFSETGYVGADVDDLVRDLVAKANGDLDLAEHGIIYLDEIDKISSGPEKLGRDVSGRGVQTALLKLMEETEVPLYAPNDIRSQMQMMFDTRKGRTGREVVNTRNILFIVSGAFSGLDKIIERRTNRKSIGFVAKDAQAPSSEHLFREVRTKDFIDYGFEAEFIGRLPVRVVCDPLSADDMFQIMKNSEGSLIRQYEREFAAYGVKAVFEDDALHEIASRAEEEKTGARGLVTAWERVLRDFKFEMPSLGLPELRIDGALVKDPEKRLVECRAEASSQVMELGAAHAGEVRAFADGFQREHGFTLDFDSAAVAAIAARAQREGMHVDAMCAKLFKDYPFGLKLVTRSTGETRFVIPADAVAHPDKFVSELVVEACRPSSAVEPPVIDLAPENTSHES